MAFQRQPSVSIQRRPCITPTNDALRTTPGPDSVQQHALDDSHEWVLFPSNQARSTTTATGQDSTDQTHRIDAPSRLSDFDSLKTNTQSIQENSTASGATDVSQVDNEVDIDQELNSLDDGLHDFHAQQPSRLLSEYFHPSSSILPRHDGLGTFHVSTPHLEDLNRRDHGHEYTSRKRSFRDHRQLSTSQDKEFNDVVSIETERRDRIERWRLEHSKVMSVEIEKEFRRQRPRSCGEDGKTQKRWESLLDSRRLQKILQMNSVDEEREGSVDDSQGDDSPSETVWQRITRRVIQDFLGLDDTMLSVIFGEELVQVPESTTNDPPPAKARRLDESVVQPNTSMESSWEKNVLLRIARELGFLLSHLSEHPGAFSGPELAHPSLPDYAGIPLTQPTSSKTRRQPSEAERMPRLDLGTGLDRSALPVSSSSILDSHLIDAFPQSPETETSSYAALWGIEEEQSSRGSHHKSTNPDQEYWESAPDLKTIFQRLVFTRFTSSDPTDGHRTHKTTSQSHPHAVPTSPRNLAATTRTPDSLRRAALIRQYHPLTSKHQNHSQRHRRSFLHSHAGSSCASESIKRRGPASWLVRGGSSSATSMATARNFWDLGGSPGGGGGGEV